MTMLDADIALRLEAGVEPDPVHTGEVRKETPVSYTHLTLPTKRIV